MDFNHTTPPSYRALPRPAIVPCPFSLYDRARMPITRTRVTSDRRKVSPTTPCDPLQKWQLPPLPRWVGMGRPEPGRNQPSLTELSRLTKSRLSRAGDQHTKARIESSLIVWLYEAIRLNIKRGRLFEIDRVLGECQADCLGYATLFQRIGKRLGLHTGIVEVVIDNAGRLVPHVINIARLSDESTRFIDLWYGSKNIRHRRLGLMVKGRGRWQIVDADWRELRHFTNFKGLPPRCVDAITGYMIGNRHLERGIRLSDATELNCAIRCYTAAIARYPQNARLYFNRAVAYENLENGQAAEADYAVALHDEASRVRVQARQHDEVVRLMALDQIGVSSRDQEMYLLRKGFVTGREFPTERVAARCRAPADEVNRIMAEVEAQLLSITLSSPDQKTATEA
jgi:tetratricopeptide (TPR) repeat protein